MLLLLQWFGENKPAGGSSFRTSKCCRFLNIFNFFLTFQDMLLLLLLLLQWFGERNLLEAVVSVPACVVVVVAGVAPDLCLVTFLKYTF